MDIHKVSALPERLTVVELGRRRRWSEEEKLRIVLESLVAPRLVSAVARRHGITRSLLSDWRRTLKVERIRAEPAPVVVPAVVVPEPPLPAKTSPRPRAPRQAAQDRMVIEVGRRRRDRGGDRRAEGRLIIGPPARTRPGSHRTCAMGSLPLERGSRAPAAVACSHGGGGPTRPAPSMSGRHRRPPASALVGRPGDQRRPPMCGRPPWCKRKVMLRGRVAA